MPANKNELQWKATVKAYPAIADLQAISGFVRRMDFDVNVGAPNYIQHAYTIPADKIFKLEYLMAMCAQADPTKIEFGLLSGIDNYVYYISPYGAAWEAHNWDKPIVYNEAEVVTVKWTGTLATTDTFVTLFGYLFDKY